LRRSRPSMNGAGSWSGTTVTDGVTTSSAAGVLSTSASKLRGRGPFCICSIGVCEKRLRLSRIVCESEVKESEDGDWGSANWWNYCAALRQEPSSSSVVVVSKVSSMHFSRQLLYEIGIGIRDVNGYSGGICLRNDLFLH